MIKSFSIATTALLGLISIFSGFFLFSNLNTEAYENVLLQRAGYRDILNEENHFEDREFVKRAKKSRQLRAETFDTTEKEIATGYKFGEFILIGNQEISLSDIQMLNNKFLVNDFKTTSTSSGEEQILISNKLNLKLQKLEATKIDQEIKNIVSGIENILNRKASANKINQRASLPNDPQVRNQTYLTTNVMNYSESYSITRGSSKVKVGIMDDFYFLQDDQFANSVKTSSNTYRAYLGASIRKLKRATFYHGSGVASVAVSKSNNRLGLAGVCGNCTYIPLHSDYTTIGDVEMLDQVIARKEKFDVINMSFGLRAVEFDVNLYESRMKKLKAQGTTLVASAGNCGPSNSSIYITRCDGDFDSKTDDQDDIGYITYPASSQYVIAVGSINVDSRVSDFSSYGGKIALMAPGENIRIESQSATTTSFYTYSEGTSYSAPMVTGTVGLMKSVNPSLTPDQVENILKSTASSIQVDSEYVGKVGAGKLNVGAAVKRARNLN